jgi:hypothetical protein
MSQQKSMKIDYQTLLQYILMLDTSMLGVLVPNVPSQKNWEDGWLIISLEKVDAFCYTVVTLYLLIKNVP